MLVSTSWTSGKRASSMSHPKDCSAVAADRSARSTAAAVCALNAAIYQAPATVIMVSPSQRQSIELYRAFHSMYARLPGRPAAQYETMTRLELENGSRIISLPGSERTIRGLASVDLIVLDEAARVDDELLAAIRPMLAVSNGSLFALTTPAGKRGWFYGGPPRSGRRQADVSVWVSGAVAAQHDLPEHRPACPAPP